MIKGFEAPRVVVSNRSIGALALAAVLSVSACGSDSETNQTGNGDRQDGGGASGGGASGSGDSGGGGTSMGGSGGAATCAPVAAPGSGSVTRATKLTDIGDANEVDAWCDGSFAVTGRSSAKTSFERRDLTTIDLPDAPLFIARYDRDGYALWAKAIPTGDIGSAQPTWVRAFPDGSAALCGVFGTNATFGAGEANETKFQGTQAAQGFLARYAADGSLRWAHKLADIGDNYVFGLSAGPNGVTYAVVANSNPAGITLAPGELDFPLGENEGAVVALSADGHFLHAVRYAVSVLQEMRLTTLANDGVMLAGTSYADLVLAKGTPKATSVPPDDAMFYARFTADLTLDSMHGVPLSSSAYASAGFPDGSIVFVGSFDSSITLGAGDPNPVTYTNSGQVTGGYVARFDKDGHLAWATELAGDYDVDPYTVTSTADGSIWVVGNYALGDTNVQSSKLTIAPGTADAVTLSTTGPLQFLARLDAKGKPIWITPFSGATMPHTRALAASPISAIAIGNFGGSAEFGSPGKSLTTGDQGIFLALLGP